MANKKKSIILGVTGSIAAYKAVDLIKGFSQRNILVDVVMTKEAREFVTPLLLENFSKRKVYTDLFDSIENFDVEHIQLAKRSKVVLVAPATANIIGKVASGIYDDLLTCVIAATKAKVFFAPAMNENMYKNPIVQSNIKKLKTFGMGFIGPRRGMLACGEEGWGCLEETDKIVNSIRRFL